MHSIINGVLIKKQEPGIKEDTSAIFNKIVNKKFSAIPKNCANGRKTMEIKYTTNPNIVAISIIGAASILEIQKVIDMVLNLYAIMGIRMILAESVMLKEFTIYFISLYFVISLNTL